MLQLSKAGNILIVDDLFAKSYLLCRSAHHAQIPMAILTCHSDRLDMAQDEQLMTQNDKIRFTLT